MALPDLSGSNIQDTYQRVLHTDGTSITDGTGSEVLSAAELTTLQTIGSANIDSTEWLEIANIGNAEITSQQWQYLGAMNQGVATSQFPHFQGIRASTITGNVDGEKQPSYASPSGRSGFGFTGLGNSTPIHVIHGNVVTTTFDTEGNISCSGNLLFDTIDGGTF